MALQQALGTNIPRTGVRLPPAAPAAPVTPPPDAGAQFEAGAEQKRKELEPLQKRITGLETEQQTLMGERTQFEAEQKAREAAGRADIQQQYAQRRAEAPLAQELAEKTQQEKDFFFRPSQEDGMMMAALGSLIAVLGTSIGRGGKGNAMAALSGMNGMMQGYQQGRDDIFKKEKSAFETNAKALTNQITAIRKSLEDYERMLVTDKESAEAKLQEDLSKQGADFLKARAGREGVLKLLPELRRQEAKLKEELGKYESKARDARTKAQAAEEAAKKREEEARQRAADREFQIRLAASLRPVKEAATPGLKPSAKIQEGYIANNILIQDLDNMASKLKDPKIVEGLRKYRLEAFLTEEGKVLNQVLEQEIPSDLRKFLTEVRDVRNNYYLNMSGKAVTGGEALRNYGTVPQPGDTPEVMSDKIAGMKNRVQQMSDIQRNLYGLPDLAKVKLQGMQPAINPGESYPTTVDQSAGQPAGLPAAPSAAKPTHTLRGRPIIVRDGKWVFQDTGEEAK